MFTLSAWSAAAERIAVEAWRKRLTAAGFRVVEEENVTNG